ncbi:hypothetical protein [Limosilactobacillus sp.]
MLTSWHSINGKNYYLDPSGAWKPGNNSGNEAGTWIN